MSKQEQYVSSQLKNYRIPLGCVDPDNKGWIHSCYGPLSKRRQIRCTTPSTLFSKAQMSFGERHKVHVASKGSLSAGINDFEAKNYFICMAPCANSVEKEVGTSSNFCRLTTY